MSHNPELDAAMYLGGAMSRDRARAFEEHLIDCEECWREVAEGREGRAMFESTREMAPVEFREDVRAAIAAHDQVQPRRGRVWFAIAAAFVLLVAGGSTYLVARSPSQPVAIAAAIADFRTGRLPVDAAPSRPAPDLSAAGLRLTSSGAGRVGALEIDAYAYRDASGRRVLLYLSDHPFPTAAGAQSIDGPESPWIAHDGDIQLLCAQRPHALLLLSEQSSALQRAAATLGVW